MPKYYEFKVAGYYLYFTSHCVIECMHVHASDRKLTEAGSAKFFVENTGESVLKNRGILSDKEILQAITNHTTASSKMSLLDMCIYCADKYDPGRGYDSSREIALCKKDICEGFKQSLIDFVAFSKQKNRTIDPIFNEVYETYVKEDRNG